MQPKHVEKRIPVSSLLVDAQNPRLPEIHETQQEIIRAMLRAQDEKVIELARHLVEHGPNPGDLLTVMPSPDDDGMYIVLDGNRRLTALKILEVPELAEGILGKSSLVTLRRMSRKYHTTPIAELPCIVMPDRDTADVWVQLTHRGQNKGAGLVEWDGQVAARYDARKGRKSTALQIMDFVRKQGVLSDQTRQKIDTGKFPITTLQRLLNTRYVRKKIGIEVTGGEVMITYPEEEVLKPLTRIVEDIGSRRITVSDIKHQHERISYVGSLSSEELPDTGRALGKARLLSETATSVAVAPNNNRGTKRVRGPRIRSALIPRDCRVDVTHPRIRQIGAELERLDLDQFPNSGAVMFRVFLELSIDYYLQHTINMTEAQIQGLRLSQKLNRVSNHLESAGAMTSQELLPVRQAAGGETLLAASVKTLHAYVHSRHYSPIPSELKTAWDNLQAFFVEIWP